jgi:ferredoxin
MNIISVKLVYFSPTKTTQKVLEGIAEALEVGNINYLDLTPPDAQTRRFEELKDELVIIGTPVYGGRVPIDAIPRLRRLKANNTPAVIVVVYGNRDYGDALLELKDLAIEIGFKPVAAGVFIGEHLILTMATGRPDTEDLKKAREFGEKIRENLKDVKAIGDVSPLQVPSNFPYIERQYARDIVKRHPFTKETLCTKCETCVTVCPTAAIKVNDTVITDTDACILCHACIKNCPTQARVINTRVAMKIARFLCKNFSKRKEPEYFFSSINIKTRL